MIEGAEEMGIYVGLEDRAGLLPPQPIKGG